MSYIFFAAQEEDGMIPAILNSDSTKPSGSSGITTLSSFAVGAAAKTLLVIWATDKPYNDSVVATATTFGGNAMTLLDTSAGKAGGRMYYLYTIALAGGETGDIVTTHTNASTRMIVAMSTNGTIRSSSDSADNGSGTNADSDYSIGGDASSQLLVSGININNNIVAQVSSEGTIQVATTDSGSSCVVGFATNTASSGANTLDWTITVSNTWSTTALVIELASGLALTSDLTFPLTFPLTFDLTG